MTSVETHAAQPDLQYFQRRFKRGALNVFQMGFGRVPALDLASVVVIFIQGIVGQLMSPKRLTSTLLASG